MNNAPYLIVSTSGRALARSARRGHHPVVVLDLFADRDTQDYATACHQLPACGWDFDAAATLAAAREFCPPPAPLVTGSGFEADPGLIAGLAAGRKLFGNTPATVAAAKDPRVFFAHLDRLAIPHPETTTVPPRQAAGWLVKTTGASGGFHIRAARLSDAAGPESAPKHYFQRRVEGTSASVLFLADGGRAHIVGFNEQWATGAGHSPFGYAGAINRVTISDALRARIAADVDALVAALGLVGLNGMDFIVGDDHYAVLEINPRPTASLDLHDDDHAAGLFDLHLRACAGELPPSFPDPLRESTTIRAHAVVYAPAAFRLARGFRFPDWCNDLPATQTDFAAGQPICMVHASGNRVAAVRKLVEQSRSELENMILERAA